jgi:hypothetical protein
MLGAVEARGAIKRGGEGGGDNRPDPRHAAQSPNHFVASDNLGEPLVCFPDLLFEGCEHDEQRLGLRENMSRELGLRDAGGEVR